MVGVFASLKWRLVVGRYRVRNGGGRGGVIAGWIGGFAVAVAVGISLAGLRTDAALAHTVVVSLFTAQFLAWGLGPIVAFGIDETVEPSKFALLPLPGRTLQLGLLTTAVIGVVPVMNVLVLVGAAGALSPRWSMFGPALLVGLLQLLCCVLFSRALATAMAGLMSGRRGRDLGVMVGFGVFVLYFSANLALNTSGRAGGGGLITGTNRVAGVLEWLPPGVLAGLPRDLAAGSGWRIGYDLMIVAATVAGLWWWWSRALRRTLTSAASTTENSGRAREWAGRETAISLFGTVRLVARRDLTLSWRDPMRRVPWLTIAFMAVAWPLLVVPTHGSVFAVAFWALFVGLQAANCHGVDGSALWLHLVAFVDPLRARGEALGHAVACLLPGLIIVLAAALVQLFVRHDWGYLPAAVGLIVAAVFGGCATAVVVAPRLPFAVRQSRRSMFAGAIAGQKGRTVGSQSAVLGGGVLVCLPALACVRLSLIVNPGWAWVALPVGVIVGVGALVSGAELGARTYLRQGPEILNLVSVGDRT